MPLELAEPSQGLLPVIWPEGARSTDQSKSRVMAAMTTRHGGVSEGVYQDWNLGLHVGDHPEAVFRNRALLCERLGLSSIAWLSQVHGVAVADLDDDAVFTQASRGTPPQADAAVTSMPGRVVAVLVADCLPVLFDAGHAVGAAHAGWRGLAAGVLMQTVNALQAKTQTPLSAWRAWLGPCIGPQVFEVGTEVRAAFLASANPALSGTAIEPCFQPTAQAGKYLCDLAGLARLQLHQLGVRAIASLPEPQRCTVQRADLFFSHRRDRVSGRQAACVWLND